MLLKNRASWVIVAKPAQEPITLAEAKRHARVTSTADDASFYRFIQTAREEAETYLSRGLFTQTWKVVYDWFAEELWLPMAAPLQSVSSVAYYDSAGALQTLSSTFYEVDTTSRPGRITRAPAQSWPSLQADKRTGRVVITYVVGWADIGSIPERIKQGIRMYVAYLESDREGGEDFGARARQAAYACWDDRVSFIEPSDSGGSYRAIAENCGR